MAQQTVGAGGLGQATPVPYSPTTPETIDSQPSEKDEEDLDLEEALTSL